MRNRKEIENEKKQKQWDNSKKRTEIKNEMK